MDKLRLYRYAILAVLFFGYGFYYFTRKSINFMFPHFGINSTASFNITKYDIGIIISSQNLAYTISKFFGGILTDLLSCRILFGSGLILSGLLNVAFKKNSPMYSIYSTSILLGLVQGPAWPCCAKILQNWLPKTSFATWWSILSTSANLAGALGPLIATWLAYNYHWSYGFMVPGCICMSMGYLAIIILRNEPADLRFVEVQNDDHNLQHLFEEDEAEENQEENENEDESENDTQSKIMMHLKKMKALCAHPFFLTICLAFFMMQFVKTLFSDWAQIYLIKSVKLDPYKASYLVSTFELSGIFGSILSGILTDYIYSYRMKIYKNINKEGQKPESIRIRMALVRYYMIGLFFFFKLFNLTLDKAMSTWLLVIIGFMNGFLTYGSISILGVIAMEFTSKSLSGTSHAIAAFSANMGSIFAGVPFAIFSKLYSWQYAFNMIEIPIFMTALFMIILRKTKTNFEPLTNTERKKK